MNDQELYLLLKQTGNSLQAIFDYFKKKNKILFDSGTSWDSGTKTIKGLQDYHIIQCNLELGGACGLAIRRHENAFFGTANINYPGWLASSAFYITLKGDAATLNWGWVNNTQSIAPDTRYGIKRIIGIEPIIPDSLSNIIGGGVLLNKVFKRGVHRLCTNS